MKFFKEFNSTANDSFITLAVIFGMFCGFLPSFNLFSLLILITVLVFRIPLVLFLINWALFSVLGTVFSQLIETTGWFVLKSAHLQGFWDFVYNLPLMRWSGFNNTLVMGGIVWSLFWGTLLFFVFKRTFAFCRDNAFGFMQKHAFLRWIIPVYSKGVIRGWGVGIVAFVFVAVSVFTFFMLDKIVKSAIVSAYEKYTHSPLYIQDLHIDIKNGKIKITGVKSKNFKISEISADFSWYYLLWKKFDIQHLVIDKIETEIKIKEFLNSASTTGKAGKNFSFSIPKPEDLLAKYPLKTEEKIKKLKKDYKRFKEFIKKTDLLINSEKEKIKKIKADINLINKKLKSLKPEDIEYIVKKTETIKKELKEIKVATAEYKKEFEKLKSEIIDDIKEVQKASKADYENIASRYDLLKNKEYLKFAETFFKPQIRAYINTAFKKYDEIKASLNKKEKNKGEYVKFKDRIKFPDFALLDGKIGVVLKNGDFNVNIKNLGFEQKLLQKPAGIKIVSHSQYYKKAVVTAEYLESLKFSFSVEGLSEKYVKFDRVVLIEPVFNIKGSGVLLHGLINIASHIDITAKEIKVHVKKLQKLIKKIHTFSVDVRVKGMEDDYEVHVNSDLDRKLSAYIKQEFQKQVLLAKKRLKNEIEKKTAKALSEVNLNTQVLKQINDVDQEAGLLLEELKKYAKSELKKRVLKEGLNRFIKF